MHRSALFLLAALALATAACGDPYVGSAEDWLPGTDLDDTGSDPGGDLADLADPVWTVVDTRQDRCYDDAEEIDCATAGDLDGQDAQYHSAAPAYEVHGDGTVTDLATGLMWQQDPGEKMSWQEAADGAATFDLAGYTDWRLPTIHELYSLIQFSGTDPSGCDTLEGCDATPFIDASVFAFQYGDTSIGERVIDAQYASSTLYVSTTMNGDETAFGVNFADGRIKGYGLADPKTGDPKGFFVLYVRGNPAFGQADYVDHGDGTVTDLATGLTWLKGDSGTLGGGDGAMDWPDALAWAEALEVAGHDDWRLPNAKELQSLVDYTRSPATTGSAAIDPVFDVSTIEDEGGGPNFPSYWTSTTHVAWGAPVPAASAVYVAFGEALGWMQGPSGDYTLLDVHGAGAQRSDPKVGDPADYPYGHGPQGDVIRIYNHVRAVRGGGAIYANLTPTSPPLSTPDAGTGPGGGSASGPDAPAACSALADCADACPPDAAMGCTCAPTPDGGNACVPACDTAADCPAPPGMQMMCTGEGFCVPSGG